MAIACWRLRGRFFTFVSILLLLLIAFFAVRTVGAQDSDTEVYLPMTVSTTADCDAPGTSYGTLAPIEGTDRPAAQHPDINLEIRGWSPTAADLSLVLYGGPTDPLAPQLESLFASDRLPQFSSAYRVNHWFWECDCRGGPITDWDVTLLGMSTSDGESLHVPRSGYTIGGGFEVLVLYATQNRLTLKYSAEDNVSQGYTLHVEGVCVEPDLLNLYEQMNAAGRDGLPALREGQVFGQATGDEVRLAIRDNGSFLDPRSQKDWWKEYSVP